MELVPLYAFDVEQDGSPDNPAVPELYFRNRGGQVGFRYRFENTHLNPFGKLTVFSSFCRTPELMVLLIQNFSVSRVLF